MSGSVDWQHPYVDIFRQFGVFESASSQSKGQVSVAQDNEIGRKVIRLTGAISSNNAIQVPEQQGKSLGLTGRYIYVQFYVTKGKYFTLHFDLQIKGRDPIVRLSVSNMFENNKVVQNHLQIPYPKGAKDKWTILILDVEYFLSNFGLLPHSSFTSFKNIHSLKSIQICSTMSIRGIYTSQNLYDWDTMPKPMLFKLNKGAQYQDDYQIAFWPTMGVQPQLDKQPLKDLTSNMIENLSKVRDPVQVVDEEDMKLQSQQSLSRTAKSPAQQQQQQLQQYKPVAQDDLVKRRPGDQMLYAKSIDAEDHPLQPYPIMKLERVIGFTVRNCPDIRWGRKADNQQTLVYAAGNILVCCDVNNGRQNFYMGHSQPISCLDVSRDGLWIVSGQQGKNAVIRIWDFTNVECLSAFATPYKDLIGVSFSYDCKLLVTIGSDENNREIIIVWGLQNILTTRKPLLIAKQSSNCNVLSIKFSPVDNNRLVSCGHENIKFWRIKNGHLPGASVVLNHHARNTTFAVFDFEYSYEDPQANRFQDKVNRVFFGSKQGVLFQVNYHTTELEAVYRVHDQPISSLVVSAGFCVTGSKDQFLRVWPLDFSEFYIEAKHEGIITSLDVSLDGLQVACGTSTGGLGVLDISNHGYRTVVRSHTGKVIQTEIHPYNGHLVTLSEDCTIRLWDLVKQEQVYEFTFPFDDKCTTISSHPKELFFAAGFKSGIVRIFDIEKTSVVEESKYHDCEIVHLVYSHSGHLLLVCDVKSVYRLYDAVRNYQPVKTLEQYIASKYNQSAFSMDNQVISTIGDNGTHVNLWDGSSFSILLKIFAPQCTFKQLKWAHNNIELVTACEEAKIRIYGIERSPGAVHAYFLREQLHMHRETINSFIFSDNLRFLFSVGKEAFVKVWDYEFSLKGPGSCQVFLGHSNPITNVCLATNDMVITAGGEEGIFLWSFKGYNGKNERVLDLANFTMVQTQTFGRTKQTQLEEQQKPSEAPYFDEEPQQEDQLDDIQDLNEEPSQLNTSPEKLVPLQSLSRKKQQHQSPLAHQEQSFGQKSTFKPTRLSQEFTPYVVEYMKARSKKQSPKKRAQPIPFTSSKELPYKQYEVQPKHYPQLGSDLKLRTIIAYNKDGHDNVVWCQSEGWMAFSAQNFVVVEKLAKERHQQIIEFEFEVGVLTLDPQQKFLLVGSSHKLLHEDEAPIMVVDTKTLLVVKKLGFHTRGVQKMVFTENCKYLISIGNFRECTVAVWDWPNGQLLASSYTLDKINDIQVSQFQFSKERIFEFCTVGRDQVYFWAFTKDKKLEYHDVFLERNTENNQLEEITSVDYLNFRRDAIDAPNQAPESHGSQSIGIGSQSNISMSKSYKTETELRYETRNSIDFPQEAQVVVPPQPAFDLNNTIQCVVLGLKSGEMVVLQYGTFKTVIRRQLSPGEINYIKINQSVGKMIVCTSDPVLQFMDLSKIFTLQAFIGSGLQMQRIRLPTMPIAITLDPLMQQAIVGFNSGNISFVSLQETLIASLITTMGSKAVDIVHVIQDQIVVTTQGSLIRLWDVHTGECLNEFNFTQQITSLFYDGQFKNIVIFMLGEVKVISMDRLDLYESYLPSQKHLSIDVISSCYGVFDNLAYKFALSQDGLLYTYEQLYKDQEYTIRLSQVLTIDNCCEVVALPEKKVLFLVERNTGIVNTIYVDYNQERDIELGFTLIDVGDFKASPHGNLDDREQQEQTRMLYQDLPMKTQIVPAKGFDGVYFAILDGLSYLYGRNYHQKQNIFQIGLSGFPLCLSVPENAKSFKVYVGIQNYFEVIDPTEAEEKQKHLAHLNSPLTHIEVMKRGGIIFLANEQGLCIYNL